MKRILFTLATGALLLGAAVAQAQDKAAAHKGHAGAGICKDDAQALCKDIKPGDDRVRDCLADNLDKIQNAACKDHVSKFTQMRAGVKSNCAKEIAASCQGMDVGSGLLKCLHKNIKTLSDSCKSALPKHEGKGKHHEDKPE